MKSQIKNIIESEQSSEDITKDLTKNEEFSSKSQRAVREFLPAAEELRVAAKQDPELDQTIAGYFGPEWRKKVSQLISKLD